MSDAHPSPGRRARQAAVLLALLAAGLGLAWWLLRPASEPVTLDDPMARAGAAGIAERLAEAAEEGTFRIVLTGEDLSVLVREALAASPVALGELGIDVHPAGPGAARLEAVGTVAGSGLPLRATVMARHLDQSVEFELSESRLAGVSLPGAAGRAVDDLLDGAVDLGGPLEEEGVRVDGLEVEEGALVLAGRASDPERVAERLRAAARARAGAREPPPERVGRGAVAERERAGGSVLLALGDSLAAGTGSPDHRDAFPSRLHRALGDVGGPRGYRNLAEPGATAVSMVTGGQLERARGVLEDRDVAVVVISVGANELLALLDRQPCADDLGSRACVRAVQDSAADHGAVLDEVLGTVVGAAGQAEVVLLTPYNPFSMGSGGPSEERTDEAVDQVRAVASEVAGRHGVAVADPAPAFRGRAFSLTRLRERPPDVHPTPLGHAVLAWTVQQALPQ